jgi:hypothetical protein
VTLRKVTAHVPQACAVDGQAYAEIAAFGDFEPTPPAMGYELGDVGEALPEIPQATRAIVAEASENGQTWTGEASVPASGDVDVLLLPSLGSCALSQQVGQRNGSVLAPLADGLVLVVGGSGNPVPGTFVVDLGTGVVQPVNAAMGLPQPRARTSVTAFASGALVAGGVADATVLADAQVFDPASNGFDQAHPIPIGDARADHGAVVLATGETLLVGGVGADGTTPLVSMEIVDPSTRSVRTEGIAQLAVARRAPIALRLASGEILVAGGLDGTGAPVATLEWFAPDASGTTKRARDLVTGPARAFIALDGGGALAVIAPPDGAPPTFQNVWVIDADGAIEAGVSVQGSLSAPVLFGSAGGAPVLWTGDRWLRWQPWIGAFGALDVLDATPAQIGDATCSPDPGLALWIAADVPAVTGLRFDVRGAYSGLPHPLLLGDTSETAPDRLPGPGVVAFDSTAGTTMAPGASVFVTDRTYADVDVELDAPTGEPAIVVLRDELGDELEVGGAACPGLLSPGATSEHVTRHGATVAWTAPGGAAETCPTGVAPDARLSVGVRAPASAAQSVVRNLRITRL